jgi:hypothetical protein
MSVKRLVLTTFVAASAFVPHQEVRAAIMPISGNQLYNYCTAAYAKSPSEQWLASGTCFGYVTAVMDALSSGNPLNGFKACVPVNADMNQVVDVVKNFIHDHPEKRHLVAVGLVAEAFAAAFPCRPAR